MKSSYLMSILFPIVLFALFQICLADCDNLQDVCPTDTTKIDKVFVNGFPCKNPSTVNASDFKNSRLSKAGDTDNFFRSAVTVVGAEEFHGLNTLGLSVGRIDISVDGLVLPHSHPRSSEMVFVNKGLIIAGFIDTKGNMFQKVLKDGDVFVFPRGLLHFCFNAGSESSVIFSVFNSQNPGIVSINDIKFEPDLELVNRLRKHLAFSSTLNFTSNKE